MKRNQRTSVTRLPLRSPRQVLHTPTPSVPAAAARVEPDSLAHLLNLLHGARNVAAVVVPLGKGFILTVDLPGGNNTAA